MALTIDQLNAITHRWIQPKLHNNIFDSNPYTQRLRKSGSYVSRDGGVTIDVPLNYAAATASGWYSGAETLSTLDNENLSAASYSWKNLYANISITEEDELKNSGDAAVLNLLKAKTMIAEKTVKDKLGTGLYSAGTDAKSIVGLQNIVNTTKTIGGISQSTNTFWQGVVDSTTTTMTMSALNLQFVNATVDNSAPTVALTTRTLFNSYYSLLQPAQRFQDEATAKGGFSSLLFNGIPVLADSHCPASHLFFVNEPNAILWYHPKRNVAMEPFQKPINQQVKVSRVLLMCAYGSTNNRYHAKFSALTS